MHLGVRSHSILLGNLEVEESTKACHTSHHDLVHRALKRPMVSCHINAYSRPLLVYFGQPLL